MKKTKFKCNQCGVTVKRPSGKIVEYNGNKFCSDNCKGKHNG